MTTEWIVYVLIVGGLFACAAAATDDILRRAAMPARWVWVAALLATTIFSVMSVRRAAPTYNPSIAATMRVSALRVSASRGGLLETIAHVRTWIGEVAGRIVGAAHYGLAGTVQLSLVVAWIAASAALLVLLFLVHRGMDRERRHWPLAQLFDVSVRITPSEGPAVVGITRPEIVVPRWLLARTADEQRLVVVHEREHIVARDHLLLFGGLVIAAFFPWHPAVWWVVSRLRLAIELDCDARVLHRGVQARPYGSLLIDIAGQCAGHRVGALALADRPSHLERRLLAMKHTKPRFTLVRSGTLGALAALSILVACEAKLPTSAEVEKMDVAGAEKAVMQAKVLDEAGAKNVVYKVDGVVVSADKAHALSAKRIATVHVIKGTLMNTKDSGSVYTTVNVTTGDSQENAVPMSMTSDKMKLSTEHGTLTGKKAFTGLLYVDGTLQPSSSLATLSPSDIASVEIIKGAAAGNGDSTAGNGIIRITTKHKQ